MAEALALVQLLLLVSSFSVFGEELETLPPTYPHTPSPLHPPTPSPAHPPAHAPNHHHHHHHIHSPSPSPASAPVPVKPPVPVHPLPPPPPAHHHYPPSPTPTPAPAKPPTHHHHPHPHPHPHPPTPTPAPAKPPTHPHYPPAPAKPPTHPHYPPAPAPTPTPVKPPVHPPHVPIHPPSHPFPRSFIAVQGVVFVKSCKYAGIDTLLGATPLLGAVLNLQCNNTRYKLVQKTASDKNGYFFTEAPKSITSYGAHKCNVVLVSAPNGLKPSNLHGGVTGAALRPEKPFMSHGLPFMLYTVGPLAFEPKCPH